MYTKHNIKFFRLNNTKLTINPEGYADKPSDKNNSISRIREKEYKIVIPTLR